MRRVLFAAVLCTSVAVTQTELEAQQVSPFFNTPFSIGDSARPNSEEFRRDRPLMSAEGSGWSATKRGAWIGAGLGFVAGTYGGFRLAEGFGCSLVLHNPPRPCHEKRNEFVAIAASSAIGTLLGTLVGATVGKVVGVLTPDAPNR